MMFFQIGILFNVIGIGISKDIIKYDMASMCGSTLELNDLRSWTKNITDGIVFFRQNGRNISTCRLELKNWLFGDYRNIAFHFTEYSGSGPACIHIGQFTASLMDGDVLDEGPIHGMLPSYCNGAFPVLHREFITYFMETMYVTFDSQYEGNTSFEFVFNAFDYLSDCYRADSYRCNNNRCIPNNTRCNGHNPCGDNSDCQLPGSRWKINFKSENTNIKNNNNDDNKYDNDGYNNVNHNDIKKESGLRALDKNIIIFAAVGVFVVVVATFYTWHRLRRQQPSREHPPLSVCGYAIWQHTRRQNQQGAEIELPDQPFSAITSAPHEVPNLNRPLLHQNASPREPQPSPTTHSSEPPDYSTLSVPGLPPSYEDVIGDEQKYKLSTNNTHGDS